MTTSNLQAIITTNKGTITLNLFDKDTPLTVANFVHLTEKGFYNGLKFHRVIDEFMVQGGCPQGTGTGGPGYSFEDECKATLRHNKPGILSMANSGPNTNGSQFFITHIATPWLDGKHTVFGEVASPEDQDVVNKIVQEDTIESITISGDTTPIKTELGAIMTAWDDMMKEKA